MGTVRVTTTVLVTVLPDVSGTRTVGGVGWGRGVSVGAGSSVGDWAGSGVAVGVDGAPANDDRRPGLTLAYAAAPKLAVKVISAAALMTATNFSNSVARRPSVNSDR